MTDDPQAGDALNALIAEKVMGIPVEKRVLSETGWTTYWTWEEKYHPTDKHAYTDWKLVPAYSTDPAAALAVVERMREKGFHGVIYFYTDEQAGYGPIIYQVGFMKGAIAESESAAALGLAICRAALRAVEQQS